MFGNKRIIVILTVSNSTQLKEDKFNSFVVTTENLIEIVDEWVYYQKMWVYDYSDI